MKLAKWQIATVSIIVLIIPFIIVYQLTKPDITIDTSLPFGVTERFSKGCENGIICIYNMDSITKEITITEDEESWTMHGDCVDTLNDGLARADAILKRDFAGQYPVIEGDLFKTPNKCFDLVSFQKKDWNRENRILEFVEPSHCITFPCPLYPQKIFKLEINIFTLKDVADEEDVMNFIENFGSCTDIDNCPVP